MGSAGFWEDNRRAQDLIRERSELSRLTGTVAELVRSAEDLGVLIELAAEDDGSSLEAEISAELVRLAASLARFELKVMLSGPHDGKVAIVSIHPGAGGTESQDWAQMLMRMYLRWCERAGLRAEVVDVLPGEEAGIQVRHHRGERGVPVRLSARRDRCAPARAHLAVRRVQAPADELCLGVGHSRGRRR